MKHIKLYEATMQEEMANDKILKELTDAFVQVITKSMKIKIEDIKSIDAYNKYTLLNTKYGTVRIDYELDQTGRLGNSTNT